MPSHLDAIASTPPLCVGIATSNALLISGVGSFPVDSVLLLRKRAAVKGWYSDPSVDSEDTLQLSRHSGGVSLNEIFPVLRVH